jgi:hypothetical protein
MPEDKLEYSNNGDKQFRIYNISDIDLIRNEEQQHETYLSKELKQLGIDYNPLDYRPFGMRSRNA